jgi:hypothetical protein
LVATNSNQKVNQVSNASNMTTLINKSSLVKENIVPDATKAKTIMIINLIKIKNHHIVSLLVSKIKNKFLKKETEKRRYKVFKIEIKAEAAVEEVVVAEVVVAEVVVVEVVVEEVVVEEVVVEEVVVEEVVVEEVVVEEAAVEEAAVEEAAVEEAAVEEAASEEVAVEAVVEEAVAEVAVVEEDNYYYISMLNKKIITL